MSNRQTEALLPPDAFEAQQPYPAGTSDNHEMDVAVTYVQQVEQFGFDPDLLAQRGGI